MTTWPLLFACRQEETPDPTPASTECVDPTFVIFANGLSLTVDGGGCGTVEVTDFQVSGEGTFSVSLFSDGNRVIPYVRADTDGRFDGLTATGTFPASGDAPWLGRGLPAGDERVPGPVALPISRGAAASAARAEGSSLLVGVLGGAASDARVELDDGTFAVTWGGALGLPLSGGRGVYLDPLFAAVGPDEDELWVAWSDAVVTNAGASGLRALPSGVEVPVDGGEAAVSQALEDWPDAELVTVGPGGPGPADPAALRDQIASAGRRSGLVVAPFAVDPSAPVARDHPAWFVTRPSGDPLVVDGRWVLDPSDPEAAAFVTDALAPVADFDVLFVEGLGALAAPGVRDDAPLGAIGLQLGLALVRRVADRATLVAVDAPPLMVAGLVDGVRVGVGTDGDLAGSTLGSALPLGRLFALDPGPVRLDDPDRATGRLAVSLLTGTIRVDLAVPVLAAWSPSALSPELTALGPVDGPVDLDWHRFDGPGHSVLLSDETGTTEVEGPGGADLLSGARAEPGVRVLQPGTGEVWVP